LDNGAKPAEGTGCRDDYFRFYEKEILPELGKRTSPDAIYTAGVNSQHLTMRASDRMANPFSAAWLERRRLSGAARSRDSG
jgi:hypothetical protein